MQVLQEKLESLGYTDLRKRISFLESYELDSVVKLCQECHDHTGFDWGFDVDTVSGTVKAIIDGREHLAVVYKENGLILGVALFMMVPSIKNIRHKHLYEVCWDVWPHISKVKKSKIMVSLLRYVLEYYENIADTAHISIPIENQAVCRYLQKKGFIQKELHFIKEMK
jgi:hypothetical protein